MIEHVLYDTGKTPVRVFFHVDYKALSEDGKDLSRQVSKDEVPTLQAELQSIERKIKEISLEIDHAKRQEAALNDANGMVFRIMIFADSSHLRYYKFDSRGNKFPFAVVQRIVDHGVGRNQWVADFLFAAVFCI